MLVCQIYAVKKKRIHMASHIQLHIIFTCIYIYSHLLCTSVAVKLMITSLIITFHHLEVLGCPDGPSSHAQETHQWLGGVIDLAHTGVDIHSQLSVSGATGDW